MPVTLFASMEASRSFNWCHAGMPTYNYMSENGLPFAKVFGDRIRTRRKELGFSQGVVFEKTGISAAYISSVERGTANPSLDIMVQLCVALECSIADMLRPQEA